MEGGTPGPQPAPSPGLFTRVTTLSDSCYQGRPALEKDDPGLKTELEELLTACTVGNLYTTDVYFLHFGEPRTEADGFGIRANIRSSTQG